MQSVVLLKPVGDADAEWQCTGVADDTAASVSYSLTDMVDSCRMSRLGSDHYGGTCNTGTGKNVRKMRLKTCLTLSTSFAASIVRMLLLLTVKSEGKSDEQATQRVMS